MPAGRSSRASSREHPSSSEARLGSANAAQPTMLLTTTPSLEGRLISHYLGLVHGETILGANLFRDILASIRDLIGGRARA